MRKPYEVTVTYEDKDGITQTALYGTYRTRKEADAALAALDMPEFIDSLNAQEEE